MGDILYRNTGEFTPDRLVADNAIPLTTKGIAVAAGQGTLKRGTLVGPGEDGSYRVTGSAEKDGGGKTCCDCILADDVDTSGEDAVVTAAYVTGSFNRGAVILAEGADIGSYETDLRRLGIFLKSVQEY